jgi:hypothetical protein
MPHAVYLADDENEHLLIGWVTASFSRRLNSLQWVGWFVVWLINFSKAWR